MAVGLALMSVARDVHAWQNEPADITAERRKADQECYEKSKVPVLLTFVVCVVLWFYFWFLEDDRCIPFGMLAFTCIFSLFAIRFGIYLPLEPGRRMPQS